MDQSMMLGIAVFAVCLVLGFLCIIHPGKDLTEKYKNRHEPWEYSGPKGEGGDPLEGIVRNNYTKKSPWSLKGKEYYGMSTPELEISQDKETKELVIRIAEEKMTIPMDRHFDDKEMHRFVKYGSKMYELIQKKQKEITL